VRAGLWQMPLRAGPRGFRRFVVQGRVLAERHDADVPPRHGYVWLLGVDPSAQGRGVGSRVLESVTSRCDAARAPTYLDTTNERNLSFYRRHGFGGAHTGFLPRRACPAYAVV